MATDSSRTPDGGRGARCGVEGGHAATTTGKGAFAMAGVSQVLRSRAGNLSLAVWGAG